jgi:hypothetical protein
VKTPLARFGGFSCDMEKPSGAPNVMFPTTTTLPDGRVLIAGGFSKVIEETGRFEIGQATNRAYIYDPKEATLTQTANEMNKGRGAHSAIYLPKVQKVLLVGGAERMYMEKDNTCFPFYFLKDKAGTVGFTYELFDLKNEKFLKWDTADWTDEGTELNKKARRIFAGMSLNNDGTVLVTGGGTWPSCQTKTEADSDYQIAELYRPKTDNYSGMFMDSHGALTMKAMRSGHSAVLLELRDKRATHLFWGGTEDGPIAEYYTEASGQVDGTFGVFTPVEFLDASSYKKRPYFHTMTALRDRQFLLVGGSVIKSGDLQVPSAGDGHLVDVKSNNKVGVSTVEGLDYGRYFHSATTFDADNVIIFGGFSSVVQGEDTLFSGTATDDIRFFNLTSSKFTLPGVDDAALPRAGHVAAALPDDCMLLLGGVDTVHEGLEFGPATVPVQLEVYCPSAVCPETLWPTTCYQD